MNSIMQTVMKISNRIRCRLHTILLIGIPCPGTVTEVRVDLYCAVQDTLDDTLHMQLLLRC